MRASALFRSFVPATLFRTFYINWVQKRFQLSDTNGGQLVFPPLNKYEVIPFKFFIVQPDPGQITFSKVPLDNLSLTVTINNTYDDSSPLVQQASWTKDLTEHSFTGELDLNTADFNSYMGSSAVMTPLLSFLLTEGTARSEILQSIVTINGSLVPPTYTAPNPLQRFYTADEMDALFVKFINAPGRELTLTSPGNLKQRIFGIGDDESRIDVVFDV